MRAHVFNAACAAIVAAGAIFFIQFYLPARGGVIYACGVIAGQDSVSDTMREAGYCVPWRERAESVGFNPFGRQETRRAP